MHFLPTKLSSADLPWYYNYDTRNMTFCRLISHIIEVINAHMWWDPHYDLPWDRGAHGEFVNVLTQVNCFNALFPNKHCTFDLPLLFFDFLAPEVTAALNGGYFAFWL